MTSITTRWPRRKGAFHADRRRALAKEADFHELSSITCADRHNILAKPMVLAHHINVLDSS